MSVGVAVGGYYAKRGHDYAAQIDAHDPSQPWTTTEYDIHHRLGPAANRNAYIGFGVGGALIAMIAHTGDPDLPIVRWDNPFRPERQGHGRQWHDDEIGVAGCLLSLVDAVRTGGEPTYGPHQGRLDQELILAIRQSAAAGGQPVRLPLAR